MLNERVEKRNKWENPKHAHASAVQRPLRNPSGDCIVRLKMSSWQKRLGVQKTEDVSVKTLTTLYPVAERVVMDLISIFKQFYHVWKFVRARATFYIEKLYRL